MTKIKITEHLGPHEVNVFPGGHVKIARHGTAYENTDTSAGRNVVLDPRMDERATLYIASDRSTLNDTQNQISVTSESLRWLARFFDSAADHMDRGLTVPPDRPVYENVLIVEADNGDSFYTGDLDAAKALVRKDREPVVKVHPDNHWSVDLLDGPDDSVAEFGAGRTEEQAWRYALGAYFGPADSGYDEHRLLRALSCGNWDGQPPALPPAVEGEPVVSDGLVPEGDPWKIGPSKKDGTSDLDLPQPPRDDLNFD